MHLLVARTPDIDAFLITAGSRRRGRVGPAPIARANRRYDKDDDLGVRCTERHIHFELSACQGRDTDADFRPLQMRFR
jgi:hypothetical protein